MAVIKYHIRRWKKGKREAKRLKSYPKDEIKDEDGVLDAQFPAAQSRHPCALSRVYLLPVLWILARFGSVRPDSCHTDGTGGWGGGSGASTHPI